MFNHAASTIYAISFVCSIIPCIISVVYYVKCHIISYQILFHIIPYSFILHAMSCHYLLY